MSSLAGKTKRQQQQQQPAATAAAVNRAEAAGRRSVESPPNFVGHLRGPSEVCEGERLVLECDVSGIPPPAVNWYCDDNSLVVGKGIAISYVNSRCQLAISSMTAGMSGVYMCRASNPHGKAVDSCRVTVRPAAAGGSGAFVQGTETRSSLANGRSVRPGSAKIMDVNLGTKNASLDRAAESPAAAGRALAFGQHLLKKADGLSAAPASKQADKSGPVSSSVPPPWAGTQDPKHPPVTPPAAATSAVSVKGILQQNSASPTPASSSSASNRSSSSSSSGRSAATAEPSMSARPAERGSQATIDQLPFQSSIQIQTKSSRQAGGGDPRHRSSTVNGGAMVHVRPGEEVQFFVSTPAAASTATGAADKRRQQQQQRTSQAEANGSRSAPGLLLLQSRAKSQSVEDLRRAFSKDGESGPPALTLRLPPQQPPSAGSHAASAAQGVYVARLATSKEGLVGTQPTSRSEAALSHPAASVDSRLLLAAASSASLPARVEQRGGGSRASTSAGGSGGSSVLSVDARLSVRPNSVIGLPAAETSSANTAVRGGGSSLRQATASGGSAAELQRQAAAGSTPPGQRLLKQQASLPPRGSAAAAADGSVAQPLLPSALPQQQQLLRESAGRQSAASDTRSRAVAAETVVRDAAATANGRLPVDAAQRQRTLSTDSTATSESSSSSSSASSLVGTQSGGGGGAGSVSGTRTDSVDAAAVASSRSQRADGAALAALPPHKHPYGVVAASSRPVSAVPASLTATAVLPPPPVEQASSRELASSCDQRASASSPLLLLRSASSESSVAGGRAVKPGGAASASGEGVKSLVNRFAADAEAAAGSAKEHDPARELSRVAAAASLSSLANGETMATKVTVATVSSSSMPLLARAGADRLPGGASTTAAMAAPLSQRPPEIGKAARSGGGQSAGSSSLLPAGASAMLGSKGQAAASQGPPAATITSPLVSSAVPTGSSAVSAASAPSAATNKVPPATATSADYPGRELGGSGIGGPKGVAGHPSAAAAATVAAAAPPVSGKVAAISSKLTQHKDAPATATAAVSAIAVAPPDLRSLPVSGPASPVVGKAVLASASVSKRADSLEALAARSAPPTAAVATAATTTTTSGSSSQHSAAVRTVSGSGASVAGTKESKAVAGAGSSADDETHLQLKGPRSTEANQRPASSSASSSPSLPMATGPATRPSAPATIAVASLDPLVGLAVPTQPTGKAQPLSDVEAAAPGEGASKAAELPLAADAAAVATTSAGATSQSSPNKLAGAANAVNPPVVAKGGLSGDDSSMPTAARTAPTAASFAADLISSAADSSVAAAAPPAPTLSKDDPSATAPHVPALRQESYKAELGAPPSVAADANKKPAEKAPHGSSDRKAAGAPTAAAAAAAAAPAAAPATEGDAWWIKRKAGKMPDPGHTAPAVEITADRGSRRQLHAEPQAQGAGAADTKAGSAVPCTVAPPSLERSTSAEAWSASPVVDVASETKSSEQPSTAADGSRPQQLHRAAASALGTSDSGGVRRPAAAMRAKSADAQHPAATTAAVVDGSLKAGRQLRGSSMALSGSSSAAVIGESKPAALAESRPAVLAESEEVGASVGACAAAVTVSGQPAAAETSAAAVVTQSGAGQGLPATTGRSLGHGKAAAAATADTPAAGAVTSAAAGRAVGDAAGPLGSSGAAGAPVSAGAADGAAGSCVAATGGGKVPPAQPADANAPRFVIRPRTQYVKKGQTATLRCLAEGQPKPTVTWLHAGAVLEPSSKHKMYVKNDFACLDVIAVDAPDHGEYSCLISNALGSVSASVELDVSGIGQAAVSAAAALSATAAIGSSPLLTEPAAPASGLPGHTAAPNETCSTAVVPNDIADGRLPLAAGAALQAPCPIDAGIGAGATQQQQRDEASRRSDTGRSKDASGGSHSRPVASVDPIKSDAVVQPQQAAAQGRGSLGSRLLRLSEHYSTDVAADDALFSPRPAQQRLATASELPDVGSSGGDGSGGDGCSIGSGRGKPSPRQQALNRKLDLLGTDALAFAADLDARTRTAEGAAAAPCTAAGPSGRLAAAGVDKRADGCEAPPSSAGKRAVPDGCEGGDKVHLSDAVTDETMDTSDATAPAIVNAGDAGGGGAGHAMPFSAPRFTKPLENQELTEGDSVTIECVKSPGSSVSTVTARQQADVVHELDCEELQSLDLSADCSALDVTCIPACGEDACPPDTPPAFVRTLVDCSVVEGQAVELVAEVFGTEPIDVVWVHNDEELSTDNPDYHLLREGSLCRLLITDVFVEDAGTYICEAYNKFGDCDTACSLTVRAKGGAEPPSVICPLPATLGVVEGSTVSLCCRISNVDPLDVTWSKNGRMARQGQRFKVSSENDSFSYEIQHVLTTDTGTYEVNAANDYGTVSCQCTVNVSSATPTEETDVKELLRQKRLERAAYMSTSRPRFLEILQDAEVAEGKSLALACRIDGSPAPDVQWFIDGREVKASGNVSLTYENRCTQLLIKEVVASEHQGRYTCVATNKEGQEKTTGNVTVKKSKSVCTVPNPPVGKPFVTDVTSQGMTVAWYGPDYDGGSQVICYKVEMCKLSLLKISQDKFWKTLTDQCKHTSYRVTSLVADAEYVFRIRAINTIGEGLPSEWSEPAIATDRRLSSLSDSESQFETESTYSEYSEYSEYAESEYDYDLDEAFSDHLAEIRKDVTFDDQYDIKNLLGKGKFGSVYLCTEKSTGREWAAKRIKCRPSQKGEIMNEIDIMNDLRHPKLVRLWEVFEGSKEMVLVTEYVSGGELFERIACDDFDLTETDCVRFTKQICDGVQYMHEKCILHLDLKPENIICTKRDSNQIKLIDFGLARRYKNDEAMKVMFGTPEFVAPEVINFEPIDFATDMWSIGVITYVLLSGLSPFCGDSDSETLSNVTKGQWEFDEDAFADISLCAKDFVSQLLVKRKENRMSAAACCRHLWLADSKPQRTRKLRKSKEKMKKFVARRKWQKTGMAIRALGRIRASLQAPSSNPPSSPSHDFASPPPTAATTAAAAPSPSGVTRELLGTGSSTEKEDAARVKQPAADGRNGNGGGAESATRHGSRTNGKPGARGAEPLGGLHGRQFKSDDSGYDGTNPGALVPAARRGDGDAAAVGGGGAPAGRESEQRHRSGGGDEDLAEPVFVKPLVDTSVVEGVSVCISCEVRARPAPTVAWYKDGRQLPLPGDSCRCLSDGCKHSLIIDRASVTDDAEYECRASNEAGEASSFAELYVTTAAEAGS